MATEDLLLFLLVLIFNLWSVCNHEFVDGASYQPGEGVDFCHVNDFSASNTQYEPIPLANIEDLTPAVLLSHAELGQPFAVANVSMDWKAREKWNERYFQNVFANYELFSSTFATNVSPAIDSIENVYYGVFINDKVLADFLSEDYNYPSFIPKELKMQGTIYVRIVVSIHD